MKAYRFVSEYVTEEFAHERDLLLYLIGWGQPVLLRHLADGYIEASPADEMEQVAA